MAVDASALRAALAQDSGFLNRLASLMAKIAVEVTVEDSGTPNHEVRLAYAEQVLSETGAQAIKAVSYLLHQTNFLNGTIEIVPDGYRSFSVKISTNDADAESQIRSSWNAMADLFSVQA